MNRADGGGKSGRGDRIRLLGLDIGSTTTSLLLAETTMLRNCVSGRREFAPLRWVADPVTIFTPRAGASVDAGALEAWIDMILPDAGELDGGGVLLTGLAARAENAEVLRGRLRERFGGVLVAAAGDSHLESWLAFHGSCGALSRANPEELFLNLDIGGGTTNLAVGRAGEVLATASLWIGARHVRREPGTGAVMERSGIGERFPEDAVGFMAAELGRFLAGEDVAEFLLDAPWRGNVPALANCRVVLSGGVGALFYQCRMGNVPTTPALFGDLGVELALALLACPWFADRSADEPEHRGRATVTGIALHGTEFSGATMHAGRAGLLPLHDVPVAGSVTWSATADELRALAGPGAVCIRVRGGSPTIPDLRKFAASWREFGAEGTVVFLTEADVGKTLGQLLTDWGRKECDVVVLDDLWGARDAKYVQIGAPLASGVPVTLYDLR